MNLDKAQEVYRESYAKHTNRLAQETPNLDYWFSSGPYRGTEDVERRFGIGLEQVEKYIDYYERIAPEEVIWISPDGEPGIELGFEIDLDGIPARGYIDAVIASPDHPLRVRDNKTGNKPGDSFQLSTYAVAVNDVHGTDIKDGDYWMARKGKPTPNYDLSVVSRDAVVTKFQETDASINAGDFPAKPEPSKCRFCSVASSCSFFAG